MSDNYEAAIAETGREKIQQNYILYVTVGTSTNDYLINDKTRLCSIDIISQLC